MSLASYVLWHYTKALSSGLKIWTNFISFSLHFFSVPLLLRTFFSRFGRLGEEYHSGLNIEKILTTFAVNMLMRLVGVLVRSVFIICGLIFFFLVVVVGIFLFLVWIFLPVILFLTLTYGILFVV